MKSTKILNDIVLFNIHSSGKVIGKKENRNIYVDFGIPHEIVDIEIKKHDRQGHFTYGWINAIKTESEYRVKPFCKHACFCGGCN